MLRALPLALMLAGLAAAPSLASDSGHYYRAELSQAAPASQVIAGSVLWLCNGTECVADKGTSRPVVICKRLAEATSAVMRFSYAGEDLAADDLARCNA